MDEKIRIFLEYLKMLEHKYELSQDLPDDYFEPGMMEYLDQYHGIYDAGSGKVMLRTESKGLRYDNRTSRLNTLRVNDSVQIVRDAENIYNSNNFMILAENGGNLGNLSADLCNAMAPLYDAGVLTINSSHISFVQTIQERSRYAKQGVLFVEINCTLVNEEH